MSETYLGDGVYASFDGCQIWLRTPRLGGDHTIALEPDVFEALLRYRRDLTRVKTRFGGPLEPGADWVQQPEGHYASERKQND